MMKVAVPQRFKLRVVPDVKTLIFGSGREVHYIGGTEVLPPPLEGMRESEMINRLGTEYAEDAKKVLIEHNLRLVVYIAKKFDNTGVGVEDLISIGTIGLIKAINTFNPTKAARFHPSQRSKVRRWTPPSLSCYYALPELLAFQDIYQFFI